MANDYAEFARQLKARGWRYDVEDEQSLDGVRRIDDAEELLALMPNWTLDKLAANQDHKYDDLKARLAKQSK